MGRVDIKLGYSCNDECVHCVVDDFRDRLRAEGLEQDKTTEQFRQELVESRARADAVVFTGGEPTIRQDLVELLACARDLGYQITMQSNGRRFSSPEFADLVTRTAVVRYVLALHGPCAEIHDAVTRRKGSYEQTVAGFRNLVARRQVVVAKVVLSRLNFAALPETVGQLVDLGARQVSIAFPHAQGTARKLWDVVVPRYFEVVPYLHRALDLTVAAGIGADAETFMYCHMEGYERFIGEIQQQLEKYVELRQYGDTRDIQDWTRVRWEIKRKFEPCRTCRFDAVCEGPWNEYADRYGGEEFVPLRGRRVRHVREVLDGSFRRPSPVLGCLPLVSG